MRKITIPSGQTKISFCSSKVSAVIRSLGSVKKDLFKYGGFSLLYLFLMSSSLAAPIVADENCVDELNTSAFFANPVLDLNGVTVGVDKDAQFSPTPGTLSRLATVPMLSSDTNTILTATISFAGTVDGTENLYSNFGGVNNFFLFTDASNSQSFVVNGTTIILTQNFTNFTIAEVGGNSIPNDDFLEFLNSLFYYHNTNTPTPGIRTATIEVTDPNLAAASAQSVIRVFATGPVATDDTNTIAGNSTGAITGNVLTNDTGAGLSVSEVDVYPNEVANGYETLFGIITIQANGDYIYDVDETNPSIVGLKSGEALVDVLSYTVKDNADIIDYGIISITINGVDEAPIAVDNNDSITVVTEIDVSGNIITDEGVNGVDAIDRGLSTLVWENEFSTAGPNPLYSTPVTGQIRTVDGVGLAFSSTDPDNIGVLNQNQTVAISGTNGGHFGYLRYAINAATSPSADTELIIQFDEPVFSLGFFLVDIDFSQGSVWQDQINISGLLDGVNSAFKIETTGGVVNAGGNTYYGIGNAIESDATGNINVLFEKPINELKLSYNYGPNATDNDKGTQIAGVSDIYWQGKAENVVILEIDGNPVSVGSVFVGTYGSIQVNPDGSYTYTPDTSNPAVAGLLTGDTLTENFAYVLTDGVNSDNANLIITLNGDKTAPTITIDTPIEGDGVIDSAEVGTVSISGTTTDVEDGQIVTVTFFDGTNTITTTATVSGGVWTATDADISSLNNGTITVTADVTDFGGNPTSDVESVTLDSVILDPCDALASGNPDNDGDGVSDSCDLDDDNDGILDTEECGVPLLAGNLMGTGTNAITGNYIADLFTADFSLTSPSTPEQPLGSPAPVEINNFTSGVTDGLMVIWDEGSVNPGSVFDMKLTIDNVQGGQITNFRIASNAPSSTYGAQNADKELTLTWNGGGTGVLYDPLNEIVNLPNGAIVSSGDLLDYKAGGMQIRDSQWYLDVDLSSTTFPFVLDYNTVSSVLTRNEGFAFIPTGCRDTDNDGIIDSLDLDSDNDGCNDVLESGGLDPNGDGILGAIPTTVNSNGLVIGSSPSTGGYDGANGNEIVATQVSVAATEPADQTATTGESTAFTIAVTADNSTGFTTGTPDYSTPGNANSGINYMWYLGDPDTSGTLISASDSNYSGENTNSLTINDVAGLDGTEYFVVVTHDDNVCFVEKRSATLTTLPDPCTDGAIVGTVTANDPDADGINNACDLDDDNDGVLDAEEFNRDCSSVTTQDIHFADSSFNQVAANSNDGDLVAYIKDFVSDITAVSTTTIGNGTFSVNSPNYTDGGVQVDMQSRNGTTDPVTGTTTEIVFSEPIFSLEFNLRSLARNASGTYNESQNIKFYNEGIQVQFPAVIYSGNVNPVGAGASYDQITGDAIAAILGGAAQEANFRFDINKPIDRVVISQLASANADNIGWRLVPLCAAYLDTDGDGIFDHRDIDSDNDGCNDVLESGGLDPNGDGVLGALPITVDANGLVTGTAPATGGYDGVTGNETLATQVSVAPMEPADQTATTGGSAIFTVAVTADNSTGFTTGTPDYGTPGNANSGINYMWYIGDPDTSGTLISAADTNYSGENTNSLTVNDATGLDGTEYFVIITHDDNVCLREVRSAILNIAQSDISIDKVLVDSSPYLVGDTVIYTLVVSNAGPDEATNIVVTDIPENLTITNVSGGGCTVFPCTIATLATGASNDVTITVTATIDSEGAFSNGASVVADQDDPDLTNNQDLSTDANNQGTVPSVAPVAQNDASDPSIPGNTVSLDPTADNGNGVDVDPDGTLDVTSVSLVVPAGATMVQTDAAGDIIGYTVPGEGVWEVNPVNGEISFAPLASFNDDPTDSAVYTIDDTAGNTSNQATVTIDYVPVATADISAGNDTGVPVIVDVLGNDVDGDVVDPTTVQIVGTTNPGDDLVVTGEGTWSVDPVSGAITFSPCTVVSLPDCPVVFTANPTDIEYVVSDDEGNITDAVSVSVSFDPESPIAMDDASNNNMTGDPVLIDVAGNDMDPDGTLDLTSVQIVGTANPGDDLVEPGVGVWSVDPVSGAITFTPCSAAGVPDASCVGVSTQDPQDISYTINDNDGNVSNAATVSVMYDAEPPVAQDDISLANTPGATVSIDPTADNGNGVDADPDGTLDVTSVSLVVPAGATMVQTDAAGDIIGYTVPGEGVWEVNPVNGEISFAPLAGFNDDPTNAASYTIDDNDGNPSNAATVTIDYVPVATADISAGNDTGVPVIVDVLGNDVDGDIVDPTTVQIVGTTNPGDDLVVTGEGTWSVDPVSGAITFSPCTVVSLPDCPVVFTANPTDIEYVVSDDEGNITDAVSVSVSFDPESPIAMDDSSNNNTTGDPVLIAVAGNDMDPDGTLDLTSVQIVGTANPGDDLVEPGVGVWSVDPVSGVITFTPCSAAGVPDASCVGVSTQDPQDISYTINDNDGNVSNAATVSVMYDAEPPVAQDDISLANTPGATVSIDPTADNGNGVDADPDGTLDVTSVSLVVPAGATMVQTDAVGDIIGYTVPGEGVWEVNPVNGEISFAPLAGFNDDPTDAASYTIDDNDGNPSNAATVTIDYVPVATADISAGNDTGVPVIVDVLGNDVDGDVVDPTTVQIVGTTSPGDDLVVTGEGTWSVDPVSGAITFSPCAVVSLPDCPVVFTANPTDIEYVVSDDEGNITDAVSVSVSFDPESPIAMDDSSNNNTTGDPVLIAVAGNDMDPDGTLDLTSVQIVGTANPGDDLVEPGVGVWSVDPVTGAITFTPCSAAGVPDASCVGVSTQDPQDISYTINDNDGNVSNAATVSVMYDAEPPVAQDDISLANTPGATVSIDPTADNGNGVDADPDGTLDVTSVSLVVPAGATMVQTDAAGDIIGYTVPGEGVWEVNPVNGEISFAPLAGFNDDPTGAASYTIDDNDGNPSNAATVTIDYVPVATADISAGNDTGVPVIVDVLGNDVDGDVVDPATVQIVGTTNPGDDLVVTGEGTWSVDPVSGAITFSPCTVVSLPDCPVVFTANPTDIEYVVSDDEGNITDAVSVSVSFDPESPIAMDDSSNNNTTGDPVLIAVAGNDMDPDGTLDLTSVQIVGTANPGDDLVEPGVGVWSVDPVSGVITFTPCSAAGVPDASCVGVSTQDPQDISYTINDNDGNVSNAATVSVMYDAEPPVAQDDISLANTPGATVSIDPTADNGNGVDADPDGTLDVTSVSLVVPAGATMVQTDAVGDIIGYTVPGEGVWEVNPVNGEISFAPLAGFNDDPTDAASYTIDDNDGNPSNAATVTIDYVPVATADISAGNDTGVPVIVDVLGNDVDGDVVDPTTVQIVGTTSPGDDLVVTGEGTWSVDPVSGAITFSPCAVVSLPDCPVVFTANPTDIEYVVSDDEGNITDAVSVSVSFDPESPIAMDDSSNNNTTGDPVLIAVAGNDMDPDGTLDLTSVQIVGTANPGDDLVEPGVGVWSVDPVTGAITFTPCSAAGVPDASCVGVSTQDPQDISYTINDNDGNVSNAATVSVMYDAEPPVAQDDISLANTPGATVSIDPTADNGNGVDADPDGTLDVTSVSLVVPAGATMVQTDAAGDIIGYTVPGEGVWEVNPVNGEISFAPLAGFNDDPTGAASYTIDDNDGNPSNAATVTIDYVPVATADISAGNDTGVPVIVDVLGNDVDGDVVDPATVQIVGTTNPGDDLVDPGVGVWSVDPVSGAITFTPCTGAGIPDATCTGLSVEDPAVISYTVMDNDGNTSEPAEVVVSFDECNGQGLGDCDGDGVSNEDEVNGGSNPNDPCSYNDIDQDLTIVTGEWNSLDCDMDGLSNSEEATGIDDPSTPNDPNGNTTDPQNPDTDGDGVTDGDEAGDMTDPNDPCALEIASQTVTATMAWNDLDCDMDGLNNGEELTGIDDPTTPADPNGNTTDPLDNDSDGDGVTDGQEALDGTDPNDNCSLIVANQTETPDTAYDTADCDMDGLTNIEETTGIDDPSTPNDPNGNTTDPQNPDTDGDGVTDGDEAGDMTDPNDPCALEIASQTVIATMAWNDLDCDMDGLNNGEELTGIDDPTTPADPNGNTTDPLDNDSDGDGVTDGQEALDGTDPNDHCSLIVANQTETPDTAYDTADCDMDGLTNNEEATGIDDPSTPNDPNGNTTDPQNPDTDGDGVTDGDEAGDMTDPNDPCAFEVSSQTVAVATAWNDLDCDMDGLNNGEELTGIDDPTTPADPNGNTTDPLDNDSDGDGVTDGQEALDGTDPNDNCSLIVANQTETPDAAYDTADCDMDGLTNNEEATGIDDPSTPNDPNGNTTDPQNPDTDGDGVTDGDEAGDMTDPNDPCAFEVSSQTVAVATAWNDLDCDMDGLNNGEELTGIDDPTTPADPNGNTTDPLDNDSDGDGVIDGQEALDGTDPNNPCDFLISSVTLPIDLDFSTLDCDGDGVTNGQEVSDGTDFMDPCDFLVISQTVTTSEEWGAIDCDGDGVVNGQELLDGTDPQNPCDFDPDSQNIAIITMNYDDLDCDGDGVTNGQEMEDGTDPNDLCELNLTSQNVTPSTEWYDEDCDGDGVTNGTELNDGTDPLDGCDFEYTSQTEPISNNFSDLDCDGDGVTNGQEIADGTDPADPCSFLVSSQTVTSSDAFNNSDCDGDGVSNEIESIDGTDLLDPCDYEFTSQTIDYETQTVEGVSADWLLLDCDGDSTLNGDEISDNDNNGVPDYEEADNGDADASDGLVVFDIMTPDGDGNNDVFVISGIQQYPENTLKIYNRWGVKVYDVDGYGQGNNFFRGFSEGRVTVKKDDKLPVGTYYYVLTYITSDGKSVQKAGPLYINRK
ncbi:gliding motility-associated C-terminal domain-containing protein [Psychroserpens sp. NJDZ02]|uniref:T9SS type B sorting domain-containing protein n=1 Tax=Psychroserpens sp. NJDZ02 TaxID=2570561 RepID=UPI0010A92572|nr:gliding motility-associated C-terminal domain-containing protein [Psychroserpens sp. NJDZ02]QCE41035.1 DUF11 domain-containing protein [Psychroserpens sp. NJDZ02]